MLLRINKYIGDSVTCQKVKKNQTKSNARMREHSLVRDQFEIEYF